MGDVSGWRHQLCISCLAWEWGMRAAAAARFCSLCTPRSEKGKAEGELLGGALHLLTELFRCSKCSGAPPQPLSGAALGRRNRGFVVGVAEKQDPRSLKLNAEAQLACPWLHAWSPGHG